MRQLALDLQLADYALFDTFYEGPNAATVSAVRRAATETGQQVQWIWGAPGTGRSHLLQAAVAAAGEAGHASAWVPLANDEIETGMLEGMGGLDLLCVDDVDAVAGDEAWERALFQAFEELRANDGRLLVSAAMAMPESGIGLRDLASRLASGPTWKLHALSDEDQLAALQLRSRWRGLELPDEVGQFLLRRTNRSSAALFGLLDKLDQAALTAQRRLTVPFVKSVLDS